MKYVSRHLKKRNKFNICIMMEIMSSAIYLLLLNFQYFIYYPRHRCEGVGELKCFTVLNISKLKLTATAPQPFYNVLLF